MTASLFDRVGGQAGLQQLLRSFYADVRQHVVLGPIFDAHIHDWPAHLAKIGEFWALQTGGPSTYPGGFGAAHLCLGIEPGHFSHWLRLWEINCQRSLPPQEATEMIALAHELAVRLRRVVAGRSGIALGEEPARG
ncbi:MAG: globin [Pedosphaera sp. Tous-C6FEB]|nr:MAG: globin [Pedosphaera sp. Tous-C6FEB]